MRRFILSSLVRRFLPAPADIERHQEMEVLVGVAGEGQRRQAGLPHDNADFLFQLPDQRFLGPFAQFDLAAGKFPKTRHGFAGGALGQEDTAIGVDKRAGRDENEPHDKSRLLTSGSRR